MYYNGVGVDCTMYSQCSGHSAHSSATSMASYDPPQHRLPMPSPRQIPKGRKTTKADIGMPQNLRHISQVGWDANNGLRKNNAQNTDDLCSLFRESGVTETQLQDLETREFISDFIGVFGGLPEVKKDLDKIKLRGQCSMLSARSRTSSNAAAAGAPRQHGLVPMPMPSPRQMPKPLTPISIPASKPLQSNNTSSKSLETNIIKSNRKQKGRKITKSDIGMPQDFRHVAHLGWDAGNGFDLVCAPNTDELRSLFSKAGLDETKVQDRKTRDFIHNFMKMQEGLPASTKKVLDMTKPVSRSVLPATLGVSAPTPAPSASRPAPSAPTHAPSAPTPAPSAPTPAPSAPVPGCSPVPVHLPTRRQRPSQAPPSPPASVPPSPAPRRSLPHPALISASTSSPQASPRVVSPTPAPRHSRPSPDQRKPTSWS